MKPPSMVDRMFWVITTIIALAVFALPQWSGSLSTVFGKTVETHVDPPAETGPAPLPMRLQAPCGRAWLDPGGKVIGIVFSTVYGDVFDRRDGTVRGFIGPDRIVRTAGECPVQ